MENKYTKKLLYDKDFRYFFSLYFVCTLFFEHNFITHTVGDRISSQGILLE